MNSLYSIAIGAFKASGTRWSVSAHNVANINTEDFRPHEVVQNDLPAGGVYARTRRQDQPDQVDLSKEAIEQIKAEAGMKSAIGLIRSEDEQTGAILDLIA